MIKKILVLFICLNATMLSAQSPYVLPGTMSDEIADRWDILFDFDHAVFSSQRNSARGELAYRAHQLTLNSNLAAGDLQDVQYILDDNTEFHIGMYPGLFQQNENSERTKVYDSTGVFYYIDNASIANIPNTIPKTATNNRIGIFKHIYKSKANFFEVNEPNFSLRVNPILNLRYGQAKDDENIVFQNTRGVEIRGLIDEKVYFYTSILENQTRFNNYIEQRIAKYDALPGQGFYKDFKSGVIENLQGYDYFNAQAYVGINATKSVAIELGHGKHFIGNGIRSLLLSDYGNNYFYLKFNTRIWKLHYQNLFTELAPISSVQNSGDRLLPKKYMVSHYLAYKPTPNIELGIYEAVVFARENQFEFQYLNPIIFYRIVEQFLDSPDNVLMGLNGKWNIKNRVQVYGQFVLDEFKLSEIKAGNGWWANKYGMQAGMKYINVGGIDHLDAQIEYNRVRPYTYAHRDSLENFPTISNANYSHFNQPLAHPLGANFNEVVFHLRYRPSAKWAFNGRVIRATYGQDEGLDNNGGNILLAARPVNEFGNEVGQGVTTKISSMMFDVSYQFAHNYFIDFNAIIRSADADLESFDIDTQYFGAGIRANISNNKLDY